MQVQFDNEAPLWAILFRLATTFTVSQYQVQFDNEPLLSGYTLRATLILGSRLMEVGS